MYKKLNFTLLMIGASFSMACSNAPSIAANPENTNQLDNSTHVEANPTIINQISAGAQVQKIAPVIQSLTANPTQILKADQVISLNVEAFDENGDTISYTWSATMGLLSSTKGELVTWTALKPDGVTPEEPGVAVIQLFISDGKGGTDKADINIQIRENGTARVISGISNPLQTTETQEP